MSDWEQAFNNILNGQKLNEDDTATKQMFSNATVSLDDLELPFDGKDPFLSFEVPGGQDDASAASLSNSLGKMREFESKDSAGEFGISDQLANVINNLTDEIEGLADSDALTMETYVTYISQVIDLIDSNQNDLESWKEENADEVEDAIKDGEERSKDPYGYYGHKRSDF